MVLDNTRIPVSICEESKYSNYVTILAYISDSCNYSCPYCYNKMPRSDALLDLDSLFSLCTCMRNATRKMIKIELIGGEPTLHPDLLEFCQKVQMTNTMECFVLTNFSQSMSYYSSLLQCGATITATWHSLKNDKRNEGYIDKALSISRKFIDSNQLELRIMFEPDNFDNSRYALERLVSANLGNCIQCGLLSAGSYDTHLYSKHQLDEYYQTICKAGDHRSFYRVAYKDGSIERLQFNDMFLNCNFSFSRWLCSAGKDYLYVHVDGSVYPCETYFYDMPASSSIGNICDIKRINTKKTLCKCKFCTSCDFGIPKQKVFA